MTAERILFVVLRLVLGGMMIYGGVDKFARPIPEPVEVVEKASRFTEPEQESTLQKILYVSGAKQTGYFWPLLGFCEIFFGLLLVLQYPAFTGAVFLLPITLQIFLFHAFLEGDEVWKLLQVSGLFLINIVLVLRERKRWKPLLWIRP